MLRGLSQAGWGGVSVPECVSWEGGVLVRPFNLNEYSSIHALKVRWWAVQFSPSRFRSLQNRLLLEPSAPGIRPPQCLVVHQIQPVLSSCDSSCDIFKLI